MSKCELHICNDEYEMIKNATYIDDAGKPFDLSWYCNVGNYQDSVIVGKYDDLIEEKNDYVRFYPHGYHNQEGNKIEFYCIDVDEVIIYNDTNEELNVDGRIVDVGNILHLNRKGMQIK